MTYHDHSHPNKTNAYKPVIDNIKLIIIVMVMVMVMVMVVVMIMIIIMVIIMVIILVIVMVISGGGAIGLISIGNEPLSLSEIVEILIGRRV